jgi:hypothetical protein
MMCQHGLAETDPACADPPPPQGFLPTLLEDAPDMAVKFAVYESLRAMHTRMQGRDVSGTRGAAAPGGAPAPPACMHAHGHCTQARPPAPASVPPQQHTLWPRRPTSPAPRPPLPLPPPLQPSILEDLLMGGSAGAAAAAATTPLDVVKTRMMCSASSRPTFTGAIKAIMAEGGGMRDFFRGVGPRALSNGLNSAIFFCFFEAIRRWAGCCCCGGGAAAGGGPCCCCGAAAGGGPCCAVCCRALHVEVARLPALPLAPLLLL